MIVVLQFHIDEVCLNYSTEFNMLEPNEAFIIRAWCWLKAVSQYCINYFAISAFMCISILQIH